MWALSSRSHIILLKVDILSKFGMALDQELTGSYISDIMDRKLLFPGILLGFVVFRGTSLFVNSTGALPLKGIDTTGRVSKCNAFTTHRHTGLVATAHNYPPTPSELFPSKVTQFAD